MSSHQHGLFSTGLALGEGCDRPPSEVLCRYR